MSKKTQEAYLAGGKTLREYVLKDQWVHYTVARDILSDMNHLLTYPPTHRMPGMLLIGSTNNGKTMLLNKFKKLNRPYMEEGEDFIKVPVLSLQAPPVPDEKRLYNIILNELHVPHRPVDRVDKKLLQVTNALQKVRVKVLVIDEIHHVLAGNTNKQRAFLNVLKFLSNELKINIVAAGTQEASQAMSTDPQLYDRFVPTGLPKWNMDKDYQRLLASFESIIPLPEPSNLTEEQLATRILYMSGRTIGEISALLKKATLYCIDKNLPKIDLNVLDKLKWTEPSKRKEVVNIV